MAPQCLLYLHGFRSSPRSAKAQRMMGWLAAHRPEVHAACPQLPPSPAAAIALCEARIAAWAADAALASDPRPWADRLVLVGSSLGGFYATHLAQRHGCRAVLLNPAVDPARDLAAHIGEQQAWHGEHRFFFEPRFVDELKALETGEWQDPQRLMAVLATGDEVLSFAEMQRRYARCVLRVVPGSDHALSDFNEHLPAVLAFLGLTAR